MPAVREGCRQVVFGLGGKLLTRTVYIVEGLNENFEDLLNLASMSSTEEAESKDLKEDSLVTLAPEIV